MRSPHTPGATAAAPAASRAACPTNPASPSAATQRPSLCCRIWSRAATDSCRSAACCCCCCSSCWICCCWDSHCCCWWEAPYADRRSACCCRSRAACSACSPGGEGPQMWTWLAGKRGRLQQQGLHVESPVHTTCHRQQGYRRQQHGSTAWAAGHPSHAHALVLLQQGSADNKHAHLQPPLLLLAVVPSLPLGHLLLNPPATTDTPAGTRQHAWLASAPHSKQAARA